MTRPTYHHGDLRAVILTEAARLVAERGADRVSLRELARDAGVSHAAPAHHFTDRRGLFTALATQGFQLLAEALDRRPAAVRRRGPGLCAVCHRAPRPLPSDVQQVAARRVDSELAAAEAASGAELARGVATLRDPNAQADPAGAQLAAWSLVHGFSMLWLNDAVNAQVREVDPMDTVNADRDDAVRGLIALIAARRSGRPVSSAETTPG